MKIVFLFDQTDAEGKVVATESIPFVITPDKLNLRQLQPGVSSLGVVFDQKDESGETQQYFRQIINFPIDLKKPEPPVVSAAGQEPVPVPAAVTPAPTVSTPAPEATPAPATAQVTDTVNVSKPVRKARKKATAPAITQ